MITDTVTSEHFRCPLGTAQHLPDCLTISSILISVFKGNDILALDIKFTKDVCRYTVGSGSSWALTGLRKECYFLNKYMTAARRRKADLSPWPGILIPISTGDVWLIHNADAQCPLEWRGETKGQRKKLFKFFLSCFKRWIFNLIMVLKYLLHFIFFL